MGVLESAALVAGVATMAAGLLLALRGIRVAYVRFMAAWCALFGAAQVTWVVFGFESLLGPVLESLLFASILAFAVAYPGPTLTPRRKWLIVWIFIPTVAVGLLGQIGGDGEVWTSQDFLRSFLIITSLLGVPLLLGWRAIHTRSASARYEMVWILLPLIFWVIHDGLAVLVPATRGAWWSGGQVSPPQAVYIATWLLGVTTVVLSALIVGARSPWLAPETRRAAWTFAGAVPIFVIVSFGQFVPDAGDDFRVHSLVDTLFALLLFFGIARTGIVDLRLRVRWSIKQGTLAGLFVAAFFVTSESATIFFSETSGSAYFGVIGASLLVFAFAPLQRLAERLSKRAVPVAGGAEAYLQYRRLHIYQVALEGALADGRVDVWEADTLRALRNELEISPDEHRLLATEFNKTLANVPNPVKQSE